MSNYTVGDVRRQLEGLDDSTPLFGFVISPDMIDLEYANVTITPDSEDWEEIVTRAENLANWGSHSVWDTLWSLMNDAISEFLPEPGDEEDEWNERRAQGL